MELTCYQRNKKHYKGECGNLHTSLNSFVSKFVEINVKSKLSRQMDKCGIIGNRERSSWSRKPCLTNPLDRLNSRTGKAVPVSQDSTARGPTLSQINLNKWLGSAQRWAEIGSCLSEVQISPSEKPMHLESLISWREAIQQKLEVRGTTFCCPL